MPSKSNERFLRADRKNKLERYRLENTLKSFDREKSFKAIEIDREKKIVVKAFDIVRKTSGRSDQGVPPKNKNDNDFMGAPVYQMGIRLSERRLMEWRAQEKELERSRSRSRSRLESAKSSSYDLNVNIGANKHSQSTTSCSPDDEVFSSHGPLQDLTFDPEQLTKDIQEDYKSLFSKYDIKIHLNRLKIRRDTKSASDIYRNVRQRPHTANNTVSNNGRTQSASLPVRPQTAVSMTTADRKDDILSPRTAVSECWTSNSTIESEDKILESASKNCSTSTQNVENESNNENEANCDISIKKRILNRRKISATLSDTIPEDAVFTNDNQSDEVSTSYLKKKLPSARKRSSIAVYTIQEEDSIHHEQTIESDHEDAKTEPSTDTTTQGNRRMSGRQRKVSISTVSSETRGSSGGSIFGSISDLSIDSSGHRRPSKWREFVAADNAPIPQQKSLVNVATVVRAALAFSKSARKRALTKLVEEQSADPDEIMRQERLRRLHSRNDILTAIANNWTVSNSEISSTPQYE